MTDITIELNESLLGRAIKTTAALAFLRILTKSWTDTDAYKRGIIDDNGKLIKKVRYFDSEDKSAYSFFHRLVFNIKRLLGKIPFANRLPMLTSYVAALALLREDTFGIRHSIFDVLPREALNEIRDVLEAQTTQPVDPTLGLYLDESFTPDVTYQLVSDVWSHNGPLIDPIKSGTTIRLVRRITDDFPIYEAHVVDSVDSDVTQSLLVTTLDVNKPLFESDGILMESTVSTVSADAVGNLNRVPVSSMKRDIKVFDVDDKTFGMFASPRRHYERWSKKKTPQSSSDETFSLIKKHVQRGHLVYLRDSRGRAITVRSNRKP